MTLVSGLLFHENNYMMSPSYDAMGIMIFKPPTTKQDKVQAEHCGGSDLQFLAICKINSIFALFKNRLLKNDFKRDQNGF